jgi:hypothetical protein
MSKSCSSLTVQCTRSRTAPLGAEYGKAALMVVANAASIRAIRARSTPVQLDLGLV